MVRVPTWEQNVSNLPGASNVPHATADTFGAQVGKAQEQLGKSIASAFEGIGASLASQQNENDAVTAKISASNLQADVETYTNKIRMETPPEQAHKIPQMVDEYIASKLPEYQSQVPQRYQRHFTLGATNLRNHLFVQNSAFSQNRSFDYEGERILKAGGQQAAAVIDNPDYIYNAAENLRAIADETSLPDWKKQEKLEQAGQDMIRAGIQGYAKRGDDVGAQSFKARMMTELPVLLKLRGALGNPGGPAPGLLERGNIDLGARPKVTNEDGTVSTVRSISVNVDGKEVLIPTISDDGHKLTDEEALDLYRKTGKHLGVFDTRKNADAYAVRLSKAQAQMLDAQFKGPPAVLSPTDRDQVIRTIYGEAGGEKPDGQAAVAAVIRNRMLTGRWGRTASEVVHAPGQFEPWMTEAGRERLQMLKPTDQLYQDIGAIVDKVFNGQQPDNTGGATHFYSPKVQKLMGRQPPAWSNAVKLASIGTHEFYAPEGKVGGDISGPPVQPQFFIERAQNKINVENANPVFLSRLQTAIAAAEEATGSPIKITSVHRSTEEQAGLYQRHLAGGPLAAPPGQSRHEIGAAADLADTPAREWLREHAREFGLETLKGGIDKPHIQMSRDQLASAGPMPSMAGYVHADKWIAFEREMDQQIATIRAHNSAQKQVDQHNLQRDLADESIAIQQNGISAKNPKISDDRITNLHPEDPTLLTRIQNRRAIDGEYYSKTFNLAADPETVMFQKVESLRPVAGQSDFAYRQKLYEQAQDVANRVTLQRTRDPAAAADQTEAVKQARKSAGNSPDGQSQIIDARLNAQRATGMPDSLLAPITNAEASEIGIKYLSRIGQMEPKDMQRTLLEMRDYVQAKYGKRHAYDVFTYAVKHATNVDKDTAASISSFLQRQTIGEHEAPALIRMRDNAKMQSTAALQAMEGQRNTNFLSNWWSPKKVTLSDPQTGQSAQYNVSDLADLWTNVEKNSPAFDTRYGVGSSQKVIELLRGAALASPGKPPAQPAQPKPAQPAQPAGGGEGASAAPPGAPALPQGVDWQSLITNAITQVMPGMRPLLPSGEAQPAAPAAPARGDKTSLDDTAKHLINLHQGRMTVPDYEKATGRSAAKDLETLRQRPGIAAEFKVPTDGK